MTHTCFDRDQRIAVAVFVAAAVMLIAQNFLKIWDVDYMPIRFGISMAASVAGILCIVMIVVRYRIGKWPLPLGLTAAGVYLMLKLMDIDTIRSSAMRMMGLDVWQFPRVVENSLADIVLCLLAMALVSFIIKAAQSAEEAKRQSIELLQGNVLLRQEVEDRRRAERALRESEQKYRTLFEASRDAIMTTSPETGFLSGNPAAVALFGCRDEQEFLSHTPADLSPERQPDGLSSSVKAQEMMKTAMEQGSHIFEWTHKRTDGTEFPTTVLLTRTEIGGKLLLQATVRDITEQKRAREAIEKSERMYRDALQVAGAVPYYQRYSEDHSSGTYEFVGDEIRSLTGYSPEEFTYGLWLSMTQEVRMLGELIDLSPNDAVKKAREGKGVSWRADYRIRTRGGEERWLANAAVQVHDERGRLVGSLGILQDITDRRQAEEEARKHQEELAHVLRVTTMGEMASELAHELNQPLSAIVNYAGGCIRRMQSGGRDSEEMVDAMEQVRLQAKRAGQIVSRIRQFVRKQEARLAPMDVNAMVREVFSLMEIEARRNGVPIILDLADALPPVQADAVQIEQVILNLLRNAIEAMRDTPAPGRRLTIQTLNGPDDCVEVRVRDTGCGLADEIAETMFDPFFTTKPGGLGMGLSISRSIVQSHGGRLWAAANPDGGATFSFTVPRSSATAAEAPPREGGMGG